MTDRAPAGRERGGDREQKKKKKGATVSPLRSHSFNLAAYWRLHRPLIVCEITLLYKVEQHKLYPGKWVLASGMLTELDLS